MDDHQLSADSAPGRNRSDDRLDSWKKIASYLKRDVSTVQRWERREGMPVHRHLHDQPGSVFAFRSELDAWWEGRRSGLAAEEGQRGPGLSRRARCRRRQRSQGPRLAATGLRSPLLAAVLALAGARLVRRRRPDRSGATRSPMPGSPASGTLPGTEQAAAISRDGRLVAFLAAADGQTDAWVSTVGSGAYRNLTHGQVPELVNPSIRTLGFSADSSLVSIWTRRADGSQPGDVNILAVPTAGGPLQPYLRDAAEFDWSHDGTRLVYHTTAPGDPLFVRPRAGLPGADRRVYVAPAGVHCHFPIWSPDDAYIYFVRGVPPDDWDMWRIRPSGAGLERITAHRLARGLSGDARCAHAALSGHRCRRLGSVDVRARRRAPPAAPHQLRARELHLARRQRRWHAAGRDHGAPARAACGALRSRPRAAPPAGAAPTRLLASGAGRGSVRTTWFTSPLDGQRRGSGRSGSDVRREIWGNAARAHRRRAGDLARTGAASPFGRRGRGEDAAVRDGQRRRACAGADAMRCCCAAARPGHPTGSRSCRRRVRDGEPRLMRVFLNGDPPAQLVASTRSTRSGRRDGAFVVYSGADVGTNFPLRAAAPDGRPYPMPGVMLTRGARRVAFLKNRQALVLLRGDLGHKNFWLVDLQSGAERVLSRAAARLRHPGLRCRGATARRSCSTASRRTPSWRSSSAARSRPPPQRGAQPGARGGANQTKIFSRRQCLSGGTARAAAGHGALQLIERHAVHVGEQGEQKAPRAR